MGGKRDLITNHTNYLWFTPNAGEPSAAYNGACAEYCGDSHCEHEVSHVHGAARRVRSVGEESAVEAAAPIGTPASLLQRLQLLASGAAPANSACPGAKPTRPRQAPSRGLQYGRLNFAGRANVGARTRVVIPGRQDCARNSLTRFRTRRYPVGNYFNDALLANGDAVRAQRVPASTTAKRVTPSVQRSPKGRSRHCTPNLVAHRQAPHDRRRFVSQ